MVFVITYHFGCKYAEEGLSFFNFFYLTPNYDFGNIAVTIYLVLSGGLLYNRYGLISNANKTSDGDILRGGSKPSRTTLKEFYLKRAKVIYPPFWITCLYIPLSIVRHLLTDGNAFSTAHPLTLFLSVVGFDGYAKLFGINRLGANGLHQDLRYNALEFYGMECDYSISLYIRSHYGSCVGFETGE